MKKTISLIAFSLVTLTGSAFADCGGCEKKGDKSKCEPSAEKIKEMFTTADKDKDGKLSMEEFEALATSKSCCGECSDEDKKDAKAAPAKPAAKKP